MKGSYILVVFVQRTDDLIIGALGKITFKKGFYLYVGSAMGHSGATTLVNRVKRHISSSKNKKFIGILIIYLTTRMLLYVAFT